MTDDRLPLAELMAETGDGDFLRSVAESVLQIIMEADVDGLIGAGRHERSGERSTWRNGYRDRSLDTRLGTLNLKIPKLRTGAYFPGFLEPRKTVEKALVSVIQEAWIAGVSTRRVDELVQAMGMSGISKSSVSKLCKDIDEGTVRISVCGRAVEHYAAMALMKRSPNMTANWALAMVHSRGGIFHSFSDRFKIR